MKLIVSSNYNMPVNKKENDKQVWKIRIESSKLIN